MADVFVSYAQEDRAFVGRLVEVIEAAGLDVWYDTRLRPGQSFDEVIAAELDAAGAVLVVWSAASVKSFWVRDEAQVGASRGVLVPVSADGAQPPLGFRQFQSLDLSGWRGGETAALRIVIEELRARAGRPPAAAAAPAPAPAPRSRTALPPAGPRRPVGRTRRALAAGMAALVTGGALAAWLLAGPAERTANERATEERAGAGPAEAGAMTGTGDGWTAAAGRLAAWPCSLLSVRAAAEGGEPAIEGVYGAAHDPAPLAAELAGDLGAPPAMRAASLPDIFCPVLDALRTRAHGLIAAPWEGPRAEYVIAPDARGEQARAVLVSAPVTALKPERVVYVLLIEAGVVETLMIFNGGRYEGQTQGDIPRPEALPAEGVFERTVLREGPPGPELLAFLEVDRRAPPLEDALDMLSPASAASLAALLAAPDGPVVSAARLVVLDRGWVYPPGFAAEPAPERKIEALYHWLLANRPAWYRAPPLPSPYTFAPLAFTPEAVEALYVDADLEDGPFNAAEILFSDLAPRVTDGAVPEGQLAVDTVALGTNDGRTATVRVIASRSDPGAPPVRRTIDLTLSRIGGAWLISDARWPDRGPSEMIPRGASMRNLLDAYLARAQEDEARQ